MTDATAGRTWRADSARTRRRVVVTGLGLATSLSLEVDPFWQALVAGRSGIGYIEQFDSVHFPVRIGAEVDLNAFPDPPDELSQVNRTLRFSNWAADRAWADAGLAEGAFDTWRAGVCLGAGVFPAMENRLEVGAGEDFDGEPYSFPWLKKVFERRPALTSQHQLSPVSGLISVRHGLGGPSSTVQAACASAGQAIGQAYKTIRHGRGDVMITGGADSMLSMFCVAGFILLGALSRHRNPEQASRPFDATRDGFVMGEGAGIVVLEELEHARRRGARIYAEIIGYGSSADAYRFTDIPTDGDGAIRCMRRGLDDAGIEPSAVDYINAHGTSTPQNDRIETLAIKTVFGDHAQRLAISSTKSQLGHLICAAGGIELLTTVLALHHQVLPATCNLHRPDPDCDLDYVPNESRPATAAVALSNSFGFGGQNASVVARRYEGC